jgi:hypothetical protein
VAGVEVDQSRERSAKNVDAVMESATMSEIRSA